MAALASGGLWTIAGVAVVGQPAPPDWPGYLLEVLPLAIAAVLTGLIATVGCWARWSDGTGRVGTVGVLLSVGGSVAWALALAAAFFQLEYGGLTMGTQAIALVGALLVGLVLVRTSDLPIGAAIALASAIMLFGWPMAWLAAGLAWTLVGLLLLGRRQPTDGSPFAGA
jgi:hypothetical protein